MKKFLGFMLAVLMLATVAMAADITVTLDGEVVDVESYGSPATIVEGRTLVPLRAIFEALGASVVWDNVTRTVTSVKGADTVQLTVGSDTFYKNDEPITLDVPAQIIEGRTMVSARFVAESLGCKVDWDGNTKTVIITAEKKEEAKPAPAPSADGMNCGRGLLSRGTSVPAQVVWLRLLCQDIFHSISFPLPFQCL